MASTANDLAGSFMPASVADRHFIKNKHVNLWAVNSAANLDAAVSEVGIV
jgi:hypothetical protein